jgi:hypothetical protein
LIARLPKLDAVIKPVTRNHSGLSLDKRVHLIPDAKLLVVLPETNDRLIVRRVDPEEALEKSEFDYLLVTSTPVNVVTRGSLYSYQITVKSRKGGVKYKLDSGPAGMKLSPDGRLTWTVPGDWSTKENDVIITLSDSSGQEVFHTFKIALVE